MAGYSVVFSVVDQATAQIEKINARIRQMREPMERQARAVQQFVDVSGLGKVSEGFTSIGRSAGDAFESMSRLVPVMGELTGAASIAGIVKLTQGWAQFGNELTRNATRIGTSTGNLEAYQDAITLAGGSATDMTEGLKGLTDALSRAQLGDPQAAAWFRKAGISLRDVNGHLRTSTEVLPEVIRYIDSLKSPTDRLRVANGLGSDALARMAEQFERSGKAMPEWLRQARQYTDQTKEGDETLQRYNESVGALSVSFQHLTHDIGQAAAPAVTSFNNALAGLITKLDDFNKTHPGAALVEGLVAATASWAAFRALLGTVAAAFRGVGSAAKTAGAEAATAGETAAAGARPSIGGAIGTAVKGAAAFGAGYEVGSALEPVIDQTKAGHAVLDTVGKGIANLVYGPAATEEMMPQVPAEIQKRIDAQKAANSNVPGPQSSSAPVGSFGKGYQQRSGAVTNRLAQDLNLTQAQAAGLVGNLGFESSGLTSGIHEKGLPWEKGGLGWAQWTGPRRREFEAWAKENKLDVKSDEANYGFLLHELKDPRYAGFVKQLRQAKTVEEATNTTLTQFEKPADPAASQRQRTHLAQQALGSATQLAQAQGPPVQLASSQGAPGASGAVDVTITHRRAPAGTTLAANATGAVNLNPPRTEQQQLSSVA